MPGDRAWTRCLACVSARSGWRLALCFARARSSERRQLPHPTTSLDPSLVTAPWRSPTPETPQQARAHRVQNGTVRACACPHLKPPPMLVDERGQAPALTLHPVPSRWSLSSMFAACPERSGSDTFPSSCSGYIKPPRLEYWPRTSPHNHHEHVERPQFGRASLWPSPDPRTPAIPTGQLPFSRASQAQEAAWTGPWWSPASGPAGR